MVSVNWKQRRLMGSLGKTASVSFSAKSDIQTTEFLVPEFSADRIAPTSETRRRRAVCVFNLWRSIDYRYSPVIAARMRGVGRIELAFDLMNSRCRKRSMVNPIVYSCLHPDPSINSLSIRRVQRPLSAISQPVVNLHSSAIRRRNRVYMLSIGIALEARNIVVGQLILTAILSSTLRAYINDLDIMLTAAVWESLACRYLHTHSPV